MKFGIIFILLVTGDFGNAFAQKNSIVVGLNGGIGWSEASGSRIHETANSIVSPNLALRISYNLSKRVRIKLDTRWERKGSRVFIPLLDSNEIEVDQIEGVYSYNYLSFPLMITYEMGNKFRYSISAGGYVSLLMSQSYQLKPYGSHSWPEENQIEDYSSYDFGFSFSLGCSYPLTEFLRVSFDVQKDLGLQNILANPNPLLGFEEVKLSNLAVMVGLNYRLVKK